MGGGVWESEGLWQGEYKKPMGERGNAVKAIETRTGDGDVKTREKEDASANLVQKKVQEGAPATNIEAHKGEYENVVQGIEARTGDGDVKTREK